MNGLLPWANPEKDVSFALVGGKELQIFHKSKNGSISCDFEWAPATKELASSTLQIFKDYTTSGPALVLLGVNLFLPCFSAPLL